MAKKRKPSVKQEPPSLEEAERGTPAPPTPPVDEVPAAETALGVRPAAGFPIVGIGASAGGLVLCQPCFDIWYPLGSRSWKTDFAGRLSWRSVIG